MLTNYFLKAYKPLLTKNLPKWNTKFYSSLKDFPIEKIRNLGIIAHIDAGKTTTTERLLNHSGFIRHAGNVDDGDTVMDYLPQERERGITIQSACITFPWKDHRLNLIDTPGHVDFTMEVERSIRVLDGAVTILDGVAGVESQTETVWRQSNRYKVSKLIFINKLDRVGANFEKTVNQVRTKLKGRPIIVQVPIFKIVKGDDEFECVLDLVNGLKLEWRGEDKSKELISSPLEEGSDKWDAYVQARTQLVEEVSELDDAILDAYLETSDPLAITSEQLIAALRRITLSNKGSPVLCGSSLKDIGIQPLLDSIINYLPSPSDLPIPEGILSDGKGQLVPLDTKSPVCALAFKVIYDQQRGPLTFVRVYSGSLDKRASLVNPNQNTKEKVSKLLQMYADEYEEIPNISAGNIGIVLGLKGTKTGDTLLSPQFKPNPSLKLPQLDVPNPVFSVSIEPETQKDEPDLNEALKNLLLEDPSLKLHRDEESGQLILSGMGELHLDILKHRLLNELKVNATTGNLFISYREILNQELEYNGTIEDTLLGKEVKLGMKLTITPLEEAPSEAGEFQYNILNVDKVKVKIHGSAPGTVSPFLPRDIKAQLQNGISAAISRGGKFCFPLAQLQFTVNEITIYPGQSPISSLALVSSRIVRELTSSNTSLLEPVMHVEVSVPQKYVGTVSSDLGGNLRGNIISLDSEGDDQFGRSVITATVPLSSMVGYSSHLRSQTAGSGTFSMRQSGFGKMSDSQMASFT
jgi:elongation factor G